MSDTSDTSPDATPGDGWKSLGKASFNCNERGVPGVDALPTKVDTSLKGKQMLNFVYKGDNRPYILHLPTGYDHRSPRPLVFVFHAGVWQVDAYYKSKADLRAKADATNAILVYPQGVGLVWNAAHCCAKAYVCEIDDIGFVKALLANVQAQLKIDATHINGLGHAWPDPVELEGFSHVDTIFKFFDDHPKK